MSERDPFDMADLDTSVPQEVRNLRKRVRSLSRRNVRAGKLEELAGDGGAMGPMDFGSMSVDGDKVYTDANLVEVNWWLPLNLADDLVDNIYAIAFDGSEFVYVGGNFTRIGGVDANYLARYSLIAREWSAVGTGTELNNFVYAIVVDGSDVYVGGAFSNADGIANADKVAKYNGSWSALGTGLVSDSKAIVTDGAGNIYFGSGAGVYKWDGASMTTIGLASGGGLVLSLAYDLDNGILYAGGTFNNMDSIAAADYIASWNGTIWSAIGTCNGDVLSMSIDPETDILYAAGKFTTMNSVADANYIAAWDRSNWSAVGTGLDDFAFVVSAKDSQNIVVGGIFTQAGGIDAAGIAIWSGVEWGTLSNGGGISGLTGTPYSLLQLDSESIIVGGNFNKAGSINCQNIAIYCKPLSEAIDIIASLFELYSVRTQAIIDGEVATLNAAIAAIPVETYTLQAFAAAFAPADSTTYKFGGSPAVAPTTSTTARIYIPKTGVVKVCYVYWIGTGAAGSGENVSMYVRKQNDSGSDVLIETIGDTSATKIFNNSNIGLAVTAGEFIEIVLVTPAWATNPASVTLSGTLSVEVS